MGRSEMKITPDTNILVRAVVRDDAKQARAAAKLLKHAEAIAVSLTSLCELVWVLRRVYHIGQRDISAALEALLDAANVAVNRPAVDAGLAVLNAGGDFADGLIAYEGSWLGGETFVSFDKKAVALIAKQGHQARLLS
jgi:predicted nucleic-acid-binding protein